MNPHQDYREISGSSDSGELAAAAQRGRHAWRALGLRLRGITPTALARFLLVLGGLFVVVRILASASAVLIPFVLGATLAYLLLPLVNQMERRMPRWAAILLIFTLGFLLLLLAIGYSVPLLIEQTGALLEVLPDREGIRVVLDRVEALVASFPLPVQRLIQESTPGVYETLRINATLYLQGTLTFLIGATTGLLNTFGFVLGFLIVPIWLFYALKDAQMGRQALDHLMPDWMKPDAWALLGIIDRVLRNYLRGQLILSLVVGACVFVGLNLLTMLGVEGIQSTLLLGIIAGLTESIAIIGPLLGAIPAVLMGLLTSWQTALAITILYVLVQQLENTFLVPLITGDKLNLHPALLIMIVVIASQFGLLFMILAAPLAAMTRDLFLYIYGRLADPPQPAGVIPGDARGRAPAQASREVPRAVSAEAAHGQ